MPKLKDYIPARMIMTVKYVEKIDHKFFNRSGLHNFADVSVFSN